MDKRYKHLNGEERGVILAEHLRGASLGAIGLLLGRSASTIPSVPISVRQPSG